MRFNLITLILLLFYVAASAQQQDSLNQVVYQKALQQLQQSNYQDAALQFTQLINSKFDEKEVYVKRGMAYYHLDDFQKAKADFDEAIRARINTAELFEYRGN